MATYSDPGGVFSFEYPRGWSVEPLDGGVLLLAPEPEHDWQANVYFELREDTLSRDLERAMSDLVAELAKVKGGFVLQSTAVTTIGTGAKVGRIEYGHRLEGVDLVDWELLVPAGGGAVLFVTASTALAGAAKYQPVFTRVLDSLELR